MSDDALVSRALAMLPRPSYDDELLNEAIRKLDIPRERQAEFKIDFDFAVIRISEHFPMEKWPSASKIQDKAKVIANAAESLVKHLSDVPQPLAHYLSTGTTCHRGHVDIEALLKAITPLAEEARFHADNRVVKAGGPEMSPAKKYAAAEADRFLRKFGRRPTLTKEGPFFTLSGILFEAATGRQEDLSRCCEDFLKNDQPTHGD